GDQASTGAEVYVGLTQRGVPMAYSTVYRMLQTLSYTGLLLPAGPRGRHPCYRPSPAVLNAWQAGLHRLPGWVCPGRLPHPLDLHQANFRETPPGH
ncbi:MAG: hypothetical protein K0M73_18030, partial [Hydrogenophaga sp.]|nr:hypothetical protein [Hydrogenophaga sp.]